MIEQTTLDHIRGDLSEEFRMLCAERGVGAARLWYTRQVLLSMPMLVRPAEGLRVMAIVLPLVLLDRLWCLIYSLIPMKDGLERAPGFLAANIVCACLCTVLSGASALSAALATTAALTLAVSAEPPMYVALALISVTATSHFSARLRRRLQ
jgi:hypothetical protein